MERGRKMRAEYIKCALPSILIMASLIAPAISTISLLSANPASASLDIGSAYENSAGKTTIGLISNPYKNYEYWFKGNLHSHSEGNTPAEMMAAYRSSGYSFNAITNHDYITDSEAFTDLPYFLGINGEEDSPGPPDLHIVALDISMAINENQSVQKRVIDILAQGGIAEVAHPGRSWPLENVRQAVDAGAKLMEIHGDEQSGSLARRYWDALLTENRVVYGVMVDDAHSVDEVGLFGGWNVVNAPELTKDAILQNLREGNFYCVQGPPFGIGPEIYSVTVENESVIVINAAGDYVRFIGDNGAVLDSVDLIGGRASYSLTVETRYVRMEVCGSDGVSYTQPLFISPFPLSVVISPEYQAAPPKASLTYTVTVKNLGTENDNYDLTYSGGLWDWALLDNLLEIPAGESRQTTLSVTIPENAENCRDNITVIAISRVDNRGRKSATCVAHGMSKAELSLVTLYKAGLDLNLYLENGLKLVVKFYTYMGDNQGEVVVWENVTPAHVILFENVPHPLSEPVEEVTLVLTGSGEIPVASWTATRGVLASRYIGIKSEYVKPGADKPALATEYLKIKTQYIKAP